MLSTVIHCTYVIYRVSQECIHDVDIHSWHIYGDRIVLHWCVTVMLDDKCASLYCYTPLDGSTQDETKWL
jgi:hypothetical protein